MIEVVTIDTNILFYSIDPADARKHQIAVAFVEALMNNGAPLPLQVLNEFSRTVLRRKAMPLEALQQVVSDYTKAFLVTPQAENDLAEALQAVERYRLQFWDAMLWPRRSVQAAASC